LTALKIERTDFEFTTPVPSHILGAESARHSPSIPEESQIKCSRALSDRLAGAAAEATGGNALIIGPGECLDIPLSQLATRFETLGLLDLREVPASALESLDAAGCQSVTIFREDVTGVMGDLLEEIDFTGRSRLGKLENAAVSLIRQNPRCKSSFQLNELFDFVASTLVLSQLGRPLQTRLHQSVPKAMFDAILAGPDSKQKDWVMVIDGEYRKFLTRRQVEHIQFLKKSVKPGGIVFLSMTPQLTLLESGKSRVISESELIDEKSVGEEIDRLFSVESRKTDLSWSVPLTINGQTFRRRFEIESLVLRAK
jgi:hypothetical protein